MKLHLPIKLRYALVAACLLTASAYAEVADVEGTVTDFGSTYSETPSTFTPNYVGSDAAELKAELEKQSGTTMRNVVFSSEGSKEITWGETPVTVGSTLCVREGELIIKDSVITKKVVSGQNHLNMQISGSNASLVLDNTTYSCSMKDTLAGDVMHVGGHSGAGSLTLQNNSHLDVTTWLIVGIATKSGYSNSAGYKLYNTTEGKSSGVYEGDFRHTDGAGTPFMRDLDYGTGTIHISEGCSLTVGGYIGLRDGSLTITGPGATLTTGNGSYFQQNSNIHGDTNSDMIGRASSCESVVRIENGGVWNAMGHFSTGSRDSYEAKARIYVDGAGSELNVAKTMGLGYGESGIHGTVCSTELYVTGGGAVNVGGDMVVGPLASKRGANPTYVYVDEDSTVDVKGKFTINAPTTVAPDADGIVYLGSNKHIKVDAKGFETEFFNHGSITSGSFTMNGGNLYTEGTINSSGAMLLNGGDITIGIKGAHQNTAAISASTITVADDVKYEITLTVVENLKPGRYLILEQKDRKDDAATTRNNTGTSAGTLTINGIDNYNGMTVNWEGWDLILTLDEQILIQRDPLADVVQAANWGVFQSSQAFTGTLWAPHSNAVCLTKEATKGYQPGGQSVAWVTAYSQFTEIGGSNGFKSADYNIYGAALGVEHRFSSGRIIGAALGYDLGKVSPAGMNHVDQTSLHGALYGCAGKWNVSNKGSIRADWSIAAGNTTSEHKLSAADWSQDSLQLDVRATYLHRINPRTTLNGFVGVQYYAQSDDSTARIKADSLQNLRMMMGAGISHNIGKTTVFGEVAVYNDTMRHNPSVEVDGIRYGSGANPGRLGGSISVGAEYKVNDDWALRGNYSFEGAADYHEHSLNIGAAYSF